MTIGLIVLGIIIAVCGLSFSMIIAAEMGKAKASFIVLTVTIAVSAFVIYCGAAYGPQYNVWYQKMEGLAKLKEAEQSRQIKIEEAKAKEESAKFEAQAEIARARGLAEANNIVIKSLGSPQAYLRWKWIEEVAGSNNQVIYVPTETNLPVLEAGKRQ